jgi:hypothetical protein
VAMNFTELDGTTREWMLLRFASCCQRNWRILSASCATKSSHGGHSVAWKPRCHGFSLARVQPVHPWTSSSASVSTAMASTPVPGATTARLALAAELPASVRADLTGISASTAERWSQWVKRDWAAYVGQGTAMTEETSAAAGNLLIQPAKHAKRHYN